ncbi:hypothetical protein M407DRAFT_17995 [Tulasnella calospora MUT 4182]|uniref:DUF6533 domain-containing protein n=1 Tax=Tulasnella calospora MUT 4182 TaxID=1051891 RepID=A0A0C3QWB4_9AGAM|nr:hypothetical protein M407DRAFT_17995 [Tulasnella calospora MUT 4182]
MSIPGGAFKPIWQLPPVELEVLRSDVMGYLDGLQVTHIAFMITATLLLWDIIITWDREAHYVWRTRWSFAKLIFLFNRYLAPSAFLCMVLGWFFTVQCALAAITISSVLSARLWALYDRDRRVLMVLILGFLACFLPGWVLTFRSGASSIDPGDLRIFGNVLTYIGGVTMLEGDDALDWRLKKCYHFRLPKVSCSIVIGSLIYESGIFVALLWKMFKDKKKTRIIEAFYRDGIVYYVVIFCNYAVALGTGSAWNNRAAQAILGSAFYVGIKSIACSHLILRLRSYFSHGDPVVDGHMVSDPRDEGGKGGGDSTSSSLVSTIIHFAQMISGDGGGTFEIQSKHLKNGGERPITDWEGARIEEGRGGSSTREQKAAPSLPLARLQQYPDWTDTADPAIRRSGQIDIASRSGSALTIDPLAKPLSPRQSKRSRWPRKGSGSLDQAQNEAEGNSSSSGALQNRAAARSWEEPLAIIEMEDITGATGSNI